MDLTKPANERLYNRIEKSIIENPTTEVDMDAILGVTHAQKKKNLTKIFMEYTGKVSMLENQMNMFGSDNPWVVATRMVPHDIELRSISGKRKKHQRRLRSDSGHWITSGAAYQYIARDDTSDKPTVLWTSGSTNIIKFIQAFGTDKQRSSITPIGRKRTKEQKVKISRELDERYLPDLEQVLNDPKMLDLVRSTTDKQKIYHISSLDDKIKELADAFEALRFSQPDFLLPRSYRQLTSLEPGGEVINWVGNRIETTPQIVPDVVKKAHQIVKEDLIQFSDERYKESYGVLIWYREMALPVDKETIIGSYIKDYKWLDSLAPEHDLIEKYGPIDAASVGHILDEEGDITALEASQFIMIYPFREVRIEQNQATLNTWKDELDYLEHKVKHLFMEDDNWMMDCVESIPKRITKESEIGEYAKRADIATARDLLLLKTTSMSEERMLGSLAIEDFSSLVNKSIVLSRRIKAKENGVELDRLTNYGLAEDFKSEHGITIDEFVNRLHATYSSNDYWARKADLFAKESVAGVYRLHTKKEPFKNIIPQIVGLTPSADYKEKHDRALAITDKKNNLLLFSDYAYVPTINKEYLHPHEVEAIDEILDIEVFKEHSQKEYGELIEGMIAQIEEIKGTSFYHGNLEDELRIKSVDPDIKSTSEIASVTLHDPDKIYEELIRVADEFKTKGTLPLGWIQKLKFLRTGEGYELLSRLDQSLRHKDAPVIDEASENCYFSNELVESVDDLYSQMQHQVKYNPSVLETESRKELVAGLLDDTYHVKVMNTTKKRDGKGVFSDIFPEFRYRFTKKEQYWHTDLTKIEVADVSRRIKVYNREKDADLTLVLQKA